jgi:HTH-type transcriptional regulator, glycine betaine synthesis regulator
MSSLTQARQHAQLGLSRISEFWGFPKAMGALYGALYLSPQPLSLDELVEQVGVTKGAISTNVRMLERLGMVHRQLQMGERKDYYRAETDFWKIVKGILREREKSEFDLALHTVEESIEMIDASPLELQEIELANFYRKRLQAMQSFFHTLDQIVAMIITLDEMRMGALEKLLGLKRSNRDEP